MLPLASLGSLAWVAGLLVAASGQCPPRALQTRKPQARAWLSPSSHRRFAAPRLDLL